MPTPMRKVGQVLAWSTSKQPSRATGEVELGLRVPVYGNILLVIDSVIYVRDVHYTVEQHEHGNVVWTCYTELGQLLVVPGLTSHIISVSIPD